MNTTSGRERLEYQQQLSRLASIAPVQFETVIDVGANEGQFAKLARAVYPSAKIIAFEPIPKCYQQLLHHFGSDENFIGFNVALGSESRERSFLVTDYSATSSFLRLATQHKHEFLETGNASTITVSEKQFEELYEPDQIKSPCLLKIDVQGYELEVLRNNEGLLKNVHTILVETSFVEVYEGQSLFADVFLFLHERGFVFKGNFEQLRGLGTSQIMQADAIFFNSRYTR
ncbi:MAG: FkbM family methyltransferase [Chitinophagaceae bacterium]|nr:FkbM family methyltransferase [Chitinophagaceae bacterium]